MKFKVTKSFSYCGEGNPFFSTIGEYESKVHVNEKVLKEWVKIGLAILIEEKKSPEIKEESKEKKTKKVKKTEE